jgi:N-acetylmuramoyl-L-alanine amidase
MRKIKEIYIHHSASNRDKTTMEMIKSWHIDGNNWSDIGYHYVIEGDGSIKEGRPQTRIGAHVKANNANTIGICLTGNFEKEQPTPAQIENLWKLLYGLLANYNLGKQDVKGHREFVNAKTLCPGYNLLEALKKWRGE